MNKNTHDDEWDARIERIAASLPAQDPPEHLWKRIEADIAYEKMHPEVHAHATEDSTLQWLRWRLAFLAQPRWSMAAYSVLLIAGLAVSVVIVSMRTHDTRTASVRTSSEQLLSEARDDIDQAMFFYERAITKLAVLAKQNEKNLDPRFVALQNEKILSLRTAIAECKTALDENRYHPDVQQYLLTAYVDLQTTLQELATKSN
jgi:hypothetical protein